MSYVTADEERIKELFKQAFLELFHERRDLLSELFAEVVEDYALANAIGEGQTTAVADREEVLKALEGLP